MNRIEIAGKKSDPFVLYEVNGEKFYKFYVGSKRLSETTDVIPCVISGRIIKLLEGKEKISLIGEIRTRNVEVDGNRRKESYVFVLAVQKYEYDKNEVEFTGNVCKPPVYRKTPKGRQISDCVIATQRENGFSSDYLDCIAWGNSALLFCGMEVGTLIKACGRFQSRDYTKIVDGKEEIRVAYEVSIANIEMI